MVTGDCDTDCQETTLELKSKHRLFFSPFPGLSTISDKAAVASHAQVADIESKIASGDYAEAEVESKELAALALRGIDFYDTFDQTRLKWIVTSGYASFALYTLIYTMKTYGTTAQSTLHQASASVSLDAAIAALTAGIVTVFVLEKTPWYCLYAGFPLFFVRCLLQYGRSNMFSARKWRVMSGKQAVAFVASVVASIGALFYVAVSRLTSPSSIRC